MRRDCSTLSRKGSLGDALKAIQVAKGLVGPGGATTEDDSDSVTGIMKAASPFAGVLQALVTRIGAPAAPAVPAGPALPAPTPPPTVAPPPAAARPAPAPQPTGAAPTAPTHSVLFLEIANNLNQLAGLVAVNGPANMDPKQIAGMVAAQLPDELPEDADALLFEANSFERLKQLAPKIGETPEIAEWFKKFLDEIRAIYSDDAPPGATG